MDNIKENSYILMLLDFFCESLLVHGLIALSSATIQ